MYADGESFNRRRMSIFVLNWTRLSLLTFGSIFISLVQLRLSHSTQLYTRQPFSLAADASMKPATR